MRGLDLPCTIHSDRLFVNRGAFRPAVKWPKRPFDDRALVRKSFAKLRSTLSTLCVRPAILIKFIYKNSVDYWNATCFSLFPDAGMAYVLGALDSRNGGEKKCIGRWLREFGSFKRYKMFCTLIAIIGYFCFVLTHSALQSICRTQCQLSDAFKKVKFGLRTKEIWSNLNIYVLQIFQPQKFRQIYISYNH